jgi:hypothetical protein
MVYNANIWGILMVNVTTKAAPCILWGMSCEHHLMPQTAIPTYLPGTSTPGRVPDGRASSSPSPGAPVDSVGPVGIAVDDR